jgi:5-methylcytosine-specific restriction endonuclease McrA
LPEEWQALERRDVDRDGRVLNVRRTVSSGEVIELGIDHLTSIRDGAGDEISNLRPACVRCNRGRH